MCISKFWLTFPLFCFLMACATPQNATMPRPTLQKTAVPLSVAPTLTATATIEMEPSPTSQGVATRTPAPTATTAPTLTPSPTVVPWGAPVVIGHSLLERPFEAHQFGTDENEINIVFIGGIHGGYEWNTIILAYDAIDYFRANPGAVPENVTLYIIPSANPDGQFTVTFKDGRITAEDIPADADTFWGRFNANGVDLNRNWDCEWLPTSNWRDQIVSAGSAPFSEPETVTLRDFLLEKQPAAVVFWHSAGNIIFPGGCSEANKTASQELAALYSQSSGYPLQSEFTAYAVTGDAGDWLANQNIPTVTVELRTHFDTDWDMNLKGMLAILEHYR